MQRVVVARLLLGVLCLAAPTAYAQKTKSRSRSRPAAVAPAPAAKVQAPAPAAPEPASAAASEAPAPTQKRQVAPREAEARSEGVTGRRLAVEAFAGGLFAFSRPSATVPGVGTVEASAPPVFRWGGRVSSPFYRFNESAALEWVATVGFGHTGYSQEFMGMTVSASTLGVDVVPGLRGRFAVLPQLSITGELGMGVQFSRTATRMTFAGETAEATAAGLFRFALGGQYAATEKLGIFFEPVGLHAYVGEGSAAGWSLQAGVAYAL